MNDIVIMEPCIECGRYEYESANDSTFWTTEVNITGLAKMSLTFETEVEHPETSHAFKQPICDGCIYKRTNRLKGERK